jgi:hypothetical protein
MVSLSPGNCIYPAILSSHKSCSVADAHHSRFCGRGTNGKQVGSFDACSEAVSDPRGAGADEGAAVALLTVNLSRT